MNEIGQQDQSNAAKLFSLQFLKEAKEIFVFSVIFPQASKNIYGGVQGGMISAALDEATFISILRSQKNIEKVSSTNHHVLFHKPVLLGKNTIETKFKKIGKRVINIEGNVYGADRELAATLIHSTSIIRSSEGLDEL